MGNGDADTPAKAAKVPSGQHPSGTSSPAAVYPDWSGFQPYAPIPPHGFFPSPVTPSSQAYPYMWGAQHMMPPYGTPPPPYLMYPHRGLYGHPSLPPGSHPFSAYAAPSPNGNIDTSGVATIANSGAEADGKPPEAKEKFPFKRSKGSLGSLNMITGKNNNDLGKSGVQANGVPSESRESGSEDSSEGSDAKSQNDSSVKEAGRDSFEADQTQDVNAENTCHNGVAHAQPHALINEQVPLMPIQACAPGGVAGPTANINIGMDYWSTPNPSPIVAIRGKVCGASSAGLVPSGFGGSQENSPSDLWLQHERELKRQRRKQLNRESARRSRLRKQAECEELAQRIEVLKEENNTLKAELSRVKEECQQLISDSTSLKERHDGASKGIDDSIIERSNQHSVDDYHKKH